MHALDHVVDVIQKVANAVIRILLVLIVVQVHHLFFQGADEAEAVSDEGDPGASSPWDVGDEVGSGDDLA